MNADSENENRPLASERANPASPFLDEQFAKIFLERNLPGLASSGARVATCRIVPFKYHRDRRKSVILFELSLNGPVGTPIRTSVVGRFTSEYGESGASFDLMRELWQEGFGDHSDLRICEPLLYVPACSLVVMSRASGVDLETMFASAPESLPLATTRAAKWIAKLHRTQVQTVRTHPMEEEEQKVRKAAQGLALSHPSVAGKAKGLAERILEAVRLSSKGSATLVHGDYLPKNIFFDGSTVTAIDLDRCRLFDPAKDLGKFIAQLTVNESHYRLPFRATSLRESYLSAYVEGDTRIPWGRVAAYEAVSYFQRSKREVDAGSAEYWLEKAEECLGDAR